MITRMNRFPDMRPRIPLLEKAEQDYLQGRYYSSILVTATVMDEFVDDPSGPTGGRASMRGSLKSSMWETVSRPYGTVSRPFRKRL